MCGAVLDYLVNYVEIIEIDYQVSIPDLLPFTIQRLTLGSSSKGCMDFDLCR
jgi:hypothetical protein